MTGALDGKITLRRTSDWAGFADLQIDGALLHLHVVAGPAGAVRVFPPTALDARGRALQAFALRHGLQRAVEAALTTMWPTAVIVAEDDR